jgi:hypothetical protein
MEKSRTVWQCCHLFRKINFLNIFHILQATCTKFTINICGHLTNTAGWFRETPSIPTKSSVANLLQICIYVLSGLKLELRSKLQSWNLVYSCVVITEWRKKSETGERPHRLTVLPSFPKNNFLHYLPRLSSYMYQTYHKYLWTSYKYGWVVPTNLKHSNLTQCCQLTPNLSVCFPF